MDAGSANGGRMNGTPGSRLITARLIAAALRRDDRVMSADCKRGHAVISGATRLAVFSCRMIPQGEEEPDTGAWGAGRR